MWQIITIKQVLALSAKAIKVEIEQDKPPNRRIWIPKSVIDDPEQYEEEDEDVEMHVEEWFAEKENL